MYIFIRRSLCCRAELDKTLQLYNMRAIIITVCAMEGTVLRFMNRRLHAYKTPCLPAGYQ